MYTQRSKEDAVNPEANIHSKQQLWNDSYPLWKFLYETAYLIFSFILWGFLIKDTLQYHSSPLPTLIGFIVAQFFVDFVSGLLHWGCDTWGKFETPILGPTLIRSFRMHHVDPQDITRHGFIETNATSCLPMPIVIGIGFWTNTGSFLSQTYNWMIIFAIVLGLLTNQIHKWAHMVHSKPHRIICFLQKSGLIISHERHHIHHQGEFDSSYCIINGWMNFILDRINFWRKLQQIITQLTGAIPRADDKFWRECKEK